jgi:dihydrofolate synthase / folylpolyglutamate synthase
VVITDSHSIPLHNGAIGIAIGYAGFLPVKDYRGTPDLFGRLLKVERMNVADSLAVMASFTMGEGNECTPAVIMTHVPHVLFSEEVSTDENLQLTIAREKDYFNQFLGAANWQKGGGGHIM